MTEIVWQTPAMARHDRRMAPVVLALGLVLLSIPVGLIATGQAVPGWFLLAVLSLPTVGCLVAGVRLPRAARRKLAATQELARTGSLVPARAIGWTRIPRETASTEGELQVRVTLSDGSHAILSHVCDWSDCEAAGRGTADRSVSVMLDPATGTWAIVHTGEPRTWSAVL
ncbi:hypothetical protein QI633_13020 [Nocardioides sp. QY071]|uniref:hypothetical protein n=1 Tax=Nocardioides sp. QY071 TaxID=3044187 RepID=UPI00249AA6E7|nr:hypothetical protein [Nocardioides sp. QY071]WGY04664.1 hypothetical protein QI633_13020 [Nocardioides sp. QY071]